MLKNETRYSYETLLEFNNHHIRQRKWFWIFLTIASLFVILSFGLYCFLHFTFQTEFDIMMPILFLLVVFIDLFYILYFGVIMKRVIKKNPLIDALVCYEFTDESIQDHTQSAGLTQSTTMPYSTICKVCQSENCVYLYISRVAALVVDKKGFTEGSCLELFSLLREKVDKKKIKL